MNVMDSPEKMSHDTDVWWPNGLKDKRSRFSEGQEGNEVPRIF